MTVEIIAITALIIAAWVHGFVVGYVLKRFIVNG